MPITGLNQVQLSEILNRHLTPSKEIVTPERLFGREKYLRQIERAFNSEGRNVFIFGNRGIGKTSVAVTAATINNFRDEQHIYLPCGECSSFGEVVEAGHHCPETHSIHPKRVRSVLNPNSPPVSRAG